MNPHSIIPPSSASIWGKTDGCTGWVGMAQAYPESPEAAADGAEGEATHELGEKLIVRALSTLPSSKDPVNWIGVKASNGALITQDMLEAAQLYADEVSGNIDPNVDSYGLETKIKAPRIHELSFGTSDAWRYRSAVHELIIWDAKFGYIEVEAFENWQAINYAAGLFDELGIGGVSDQDLTVRIRIVQPFAFSPQGPVKEWVVKGSDLRGYFNILEANAAKALGVNAELHTGTHCRYCQARHACPAALAAGLSLWEVSAAPLPVELPPEALGLQLKIINRAVAQLKGLQTGYQEQIKALLKTGSPIPGWDTEPSFGRKAWAKPITEVVAMGDMMGHDLRKDGALTPNQAGKLGIDPSIITAYSSIPNSGQKLVETDGMEAGRIFGAN